MKKAFVILIALSVLSVFISCTNDSAPVTYTVTVKNGETVYKQKNVAADDVYVLPSKPEDSSPLRGWKVEGREELMQPGEELKITGDTEISAVWITSCRVSFDLADDTLQAIDDMTLTLPGLPFTLRTVRI